MRPEEERTERESEIFGLLFSDEQSRIIAVASAIVGSGLLSTTPIGRTVPVRVYVVCKGKPQAKEEYFMYVGKIAVIYEDRLLF